MKNKYTIAILITIFAFVFTAHTATADTLVHETIIDAPLEDVWKAFTVKEEIESWMVPKADIDLRIGGLLRTSYNPDASLDGPEAIHQHILAYEPHKMIAFQVVKCPEGFEFADIVMQAWQVTYFEPLSPARTKIRGVGVGYKTGGKWDQMRTFFDAGNAWTYDQLRKKFANVSNNAQTKTTTEAQQVMQLLGQLTEGEWIHEGQTPDGNIFRARNVLRYGQNKQSITNRSWLGSDQGMYDHGTTHIYHDSLTQHVRFFNINEKGDVAQGPITLINDNTIEWDWRVRGTDDVYSVLMAFTGKDTYTFTLRQQTSGGDMQQLADIKFNRVSEAPERFQVAEDDNTHANH